MAGAFVNGLKVSSVRTMLLLVAIGYSITRPNISTKTTLTIIVLTGVYLIAESASQYMSIGSYLGVEIPDVVTFVVTAALVALNVIYVVWISYGTHVNMTFLRSRQQVEKLSLYKVFAGALLIFISLSVVCFVFQVTFTMTEYQDSMWSFWWVWEAFWQISYLYLTLIVAFLWRPNSNNKRYAFSAQVATGETHSGQEELSGELHLDGVPPEANYDSSDDNNVSADGESYDSDHFNQLAL